MIKLENNLPSKWTVKRIEEIFAPLEDGRTLHQGWSPQCEKEPSVTEDVWGVLKTTAIQAGEFQPEHNKLLPKALAPRPQAEVKEGDILLTCAGPRVRCGVACLVRQTRKRLIMSGKMYRFRVNPEEHDARYVEAFLQTEQARQAIDKMKTGSSDSGLNLTHERFRQLPIPVAPFPEQRRIVAEIEKQFTRLEAGVTSLRRVQANLKRYRAAVLKAACEGRLTADWRKENTADENGDGEGLLDGWENAPFSKFIESSFYGPRFGKDSYASEGVPTIRTTDIAFDGSIILEDAPRIKLSADEIDKYRLLHGDIVVTRTGATIGKCAIYDESRGSAIPSAYLIRFRFKKDLLDPKYILRFLMSPAGQRLLVGGSTAVAQPNINATTISKFVIPVPPLAEQTRIVAEVERRLSVVEELESVVTANLQRATRLRQSILQKAFTGELLEIERRAQ